MAVAEKIEVSSLNNSKPPQIQWKERGQLLNVEDEVQGRHGDEGALKHFSPEFANTLPTSEKVTFDLSEGTEEKQHNAVTTNKKAMMQFTLLFSTVPLLNKLNCKRGRTRQTGQAERPIKSCQ